MARGHRDHQSLALARDHPIKGLGYPPMVLTHNHLGPHVLAEVQKVGRSTFLCLKLQEPQLKLYTFGFNVLLIC
jgi:hypothetical protein